MRNPIEIVDDNFVEIIDVTEVDVCESLMSIKFADINEVKLFFIIGTSTSEDDKWSLTSLISANFMLIKDSQTSTSVTSIISEENQ